MTPTSTSPTLRRRVLAAELKKLRRSAGLTHTDVANRLGWPQAKVSKIESAKQGVAIEAVMALAEVCQAPPEHRTRLVELARSARTRGWWTSYADVLPAGDAVYVGLESGAEQMWTFAAETLPDLVQTRDYARGVLSAQSVPGPASEVERRLLLMLERQQVLLEGETVEFHAVIAESALRRVVGGHEVLREQLVHLGELAECSGVTLRVLPFAAGALPAAGPFTLLRFSEHAHPDIVFVRSQIECTCFDEPTTVESYQAALQRLVALALPAEQSVHFIHDLMEGARV